jgi:hypothetical protein
MSEKEREHMSTEANVAKKAEGDRRAVHEEAGDRNEVQGRVVTR